MLESNRFLILICNFKIKKLMILHYAFAKVKLIDYTCKIKKKIILKLEKLIIFPFDGK